MKALSLSPALALATDQATLLPLDSFAEEARPTQRQPIWASIHFPCLALEVCDFEEGLASVVIDGLSNSQTIYSACGVAMDHGIMPGMSLNAAHALCQNLAVKLRDAEAEFEQLKRYSQQLLCFTPTISLGQWHSAHQTKSNKKRQNKSIVTGAEDNADTLLLELSASIKLFGGQHILLDRIQQEFNQTTVVVSVAPCPAAALLMARSGMETVIDARSDLKSALGRIPLTMVDLDYPLIQKLGRCGLKTLRDVWRLPREDLGRRFGAELLYYLDQLSGDQNEAMVSVQGPLCFRQSIELPADTRHSKLVLIAAEKLLQEAKSFLQMHAAATEKIVIDLWHVNRHRGSRSRTTITVQSAQADRHPRRFMPQLIEQLERTPLGDEVDAVSILIDQVVPYVRTSEDLFDRRDRHDLDWDQLIDLITARVGEGKVYTLQPVADHRPEYVWDRGDCSQQKVDQTLIAKIEGDLPARPLWLLESPQPLCMKQLELVSDTERIEGGWWARRDVRRDYHVARNSVTRIHGGQYGWVYRDLRAYQGNPNQQSWYLHGLFA